MTIRASHATEIRALVDALGGADDVERDVAVARLAVIGVRAVDRLVAAYPSSGPDARVGILRALEAIADPRAAELARRALEEGGRVAVAAAGALRGLLGSSNERASTEALDALVEAALDVSAERRVRLAAFQALADLPAAVRDPVADALQRDGTLGADASVSSAAWQDACDGRLPDDPHALREGLQTHGPTAPLGTLQKLIDAIRARETDGRAADGWRQLRGDLHQTLAVRGSRIALYDLRETIAAATGPLPASFIAAVQTVGDASCLEALAAAWSAAQGETAWRRQLEAAFRAIAKREKLTRRSSVLKRIAARWPGMG